MPSASSHETLTIIMHFHIRVSICKAWRSNDLPWRTSSWLGLQFWIFNLQFLQILFGSAELGTKTWLICNVILQINLWNSFFKFAKFPNIVEREREITCQKSYVGLTMKTGVLICLTISSGKKHCHEIFMKRRSFSCYQSK